MSQQMTPEIITKRVADVAASVDDDEGAHGLEDALWRDVLASIADGTAEDPAACARAALATDDLAFARWRA